MSFLNPKHAQIKAEMIMNRRQERHVKRGECKNCGRKTHKKVSRLPFGSSKLEPLTVEGQVTDGKCLTCKPTPINIKTGPLPQSPVIPDTIGCEDDNMTLVSEITMDAPPIPESYRHYQAATCRPTLSSHPEAVSVETRLAEFERYAENAAYQVDSTENIMEWERDIYRVQECHAIRGRQGGDVHHERHLPGGGGGFYFEDDMEGDEELENHERTRCSIEQVQQQQFQSDSEHSISLTDDRDSRHSATHEDSAGRTGSSGHANIHKQKFHPLSKVPYFSASEKSLQLNDEIHSERISSLRQGSRASLSSHHILAESEQSISLGENPPSINSTSGSFCLQNQKFHPLSKVACFQNSEQSTIDLNASQSTAILPDDKINLCQDPRVEILEARPSRIKEAPSHDERCSNEQISYPRQKLGRERMNNNRFSLKSLSSSLNSSVDEKKRMTFSEWRSLGERRKGVQKDNNRFSLSQLDLVVPCANGESKEKNLGTETNSDEMQRPRSTSNLRMELRACQNWNSSAILRDASAEANGEDLDSEVDALFCLVDVKQKEGSPPLRKPSASGCLTSDETFDTSIHSDLDQEGEASITVTVLSKESQGHEEAAITTTTKERCQSVLFDGSADRLSSIKDIPEILHTLNSLPNDKKSADRALQSLSLLATNPDPTGSRARKEIFARDGIEILVSAIWDHIQDSQVLLALFQILWTMFATNRECKSSVGKIRESCVLEGILFTMQCHAKDPSIQQASCDLITRLTELLPIDKPEFKLAVTLLSSNVEAINTHPKAYTSCLNALHSLCQLSDENKRTFARSGIDCHSTIIQRLATSEFPSLEARELACQLFCCVTSDPIALSVLMSDSLFLKKLVCALKNPTTEESSVHFYGAAFGTLANLALESNNHSIMIDMGVVPILHEGIYVYDFSVDVNSAACTALANLSASSDMKESIVSQGGILALFLAMKSTSDNSKVQNVALRALYNLCESSDGKKNIVAGLGIISTSFFAHEGVKDIQHITCLIFCQLSGDKKCRKSMIMFSQVLDVLAKIMKLNRKEKSVQKAACRTLRNLSEESIIPKMLTKGFIPLVIDAMDSFDDSGELQEHACTLLRRMGSNCPEASVEICQREGIQKIVRSMQMMPSCALLQQASCGALRAITKGNTHKNIAISAGAVDAVICLALVHPADLKVLENVVNVLTNLSSLKKAPKVIADAGGISTVMDAMRFNSSSTGLITSGSRFIQNMTLSNSKYADEAGISPILECMDEHPDCAKLVKESCKALRCLVLKSEICKDRVIDAGGVAVIEKTMEENNKPQRWQTLLLDELFQ